ncbi:family 78 glycoside hydrolase catalytic domain [Amnibacterium sp. CER49]|uniref:family 78 glycoside hydrolase catalytic domain n=1 Tax=Amnibacterium sp. CER49 TaxID=3039161 RepID=UPI00244D341E|nr:family 78 glycoside hydrolase catalytic domain [Amnibacterium sp. CER49]MDH2443165.1 family 78 glycoside hydrolase catalytic domain [Amnibacterium sp. CER49]
MSRPTRLRSEHLVAPLGIGEPAPRLSWWLPEGALRQEAYEIETRRDGRATTTGEVASGDSVLVTAPIPPAGSRERVEWRVRVRTAEGWSDWSDPSSYECGLLRTADWTARWIEPDEESPAEPGRRPTTWLRTRFRAPEPVVRARLHITAHGVFEAHVDRRRIGDAELTPGWTQYESRLQVQTFDVSGLVCAGEEQELAVEVSDGWWRGQIGLFRAADQWGPTAGLLAQLELDGERGARTVVTTDGSWTWAPSSHLADLIAGEAIDLAHPGPRGGWRPVRVADHDLGNLVASPAPPVRRVEELPARSVRRAGRGLVVDFGQNVNGWVRLSGLDAPGARLTITYGEALDPSGDVTQANLVPEVPMLPEPLPAGQVDTVLLGDGPATAEPRHSTKGFRYVRIEGLDADLAPGSATAVVVHTDLPRIGMFRCSDERVNRLHEAAAWSFRGNACDVPTDCPTRERAGWSGDWQLFLPAAAFLFDVGGFATKWFRDFVAAQWPDGIMPNVAPQAPAEGPHGPAASLAGSAGWGDAVAILPVEQHLATGDEGILAEAWPALVRWLDRAQRIAREQRHPDRAAERPEPLPHEQHLWDAGFSFGEWLEPEPEVERLGFPAFVAADKSDVATAYLRHSTRLAARIATVLGKQREADEYAAYSERVREAWAAEFLDESGLVRPANQANCVRALAFDLVPDEARARIATQLVALVRDAGDHLTTGFLSTPLLLPALADAGHAEVAYDLLLQDSWPSWLKMIDEGATTIWERWSGYDADGMPSQSHNHYSKGAVVAFLHRYTAGIVPLEPGYRRFAVRPVPDARLDWAQASHESPYGRIRSAWHRTADGIALEVEVPPGARCEVTPPGGSISVVGPGSHRFG